MDFQHAPSLRSPCLLCLGLDHPCSVKTTHPSRANPRGLTLPFLGERGCWLPQRLPPGLGREPRRQPCVPLLWVALWGTRDGQCPPPHPHSSSRADTEATMEPRGPPTSQSMVRKADLRDQRCPTVAPDPGPEDGPPKAAAAVWREAAFSERPALLVGCEKSPGGLTCTCSPSPSQCFPPSPSGHPLHQGRWDAGSEISTAPRNPPNPPLTRSGEQQRTWT